VRLLLEELTPIGRGTLTAALHEQPLPPHWDPVATPLLAAKSGKLMMCVEDLKHFIQMAPLALAGDLLKLPRVTTGVEQHAEAEAPRVTFTAAAKAKYGSRSDQTKKLYLAFCHLAKATQSCYAKQRPAGTPAISKQSLDELQTDIVIALQSVQNNWPDQFNTPNVVSVQHNQKLQNCMGCRRC